MDISMDQVIELITLKTFFFSTFTAVSIALQVFGPGAQRSPALIYSSCQVHTMGYWCQRADERLRNSPKGNQEPLAVKGKVERPLE